MNSKGFLLIVCVIMLGMAACGRDKKDDAADLARNVYEREVNSVDTMYLKRTDFKDQLSSNGKLRAKVKGVVGFRNPGIVVELPVKNGSYVQKGDLIARIDSEEATLVLAQAQVRYQRALIDRQDALINMGYSLSDSLNIPAGALQIADIRSGYANARSDLRMAEIALERCSLYAPFAGKVANLSTRLYEQGGPNFCILVDDRVFEVDFTMLETEMDFISRDMGIELSPLHKPSERYYGRVTEINPIVDNHGQIRITGEILGHRALMDGMNVKIYLENSVPGQLVVPKTAVVMRDGHYVLFTYSNGKAEWVYIDVIMTSREYYAVAGNRAKQAELKEGDCIIVGGTVNLAHGTEVVINSNQ
ncbi:MAG: efflux RND transporter periplasmic adaptor subunit [Bacteroidales bacterium]|nr:efflux RND transporter periplasmic adaptor subunit [Bacteroidales bacterium]MCL2738640.1 efflux RND transporter periplasmic adaptor subunit [Bacteroidales bacterium]